MTAWAADKFSAETIAKALEERAGDVHTGHRATLLDTTNKRVFFGPDRFGLRCPYSSDRATVGVSLQAPATHYPAHAHAAVEPEDHEQQGHERERAPQREG